MDNRLKLKYSWTDEQLIEAARTSEHWRGVMRTLGIQTNSAGVMTRIRRDVARLKVDVSHFKGSRTWSDAELIRAVTTSFTWDDVLSALGLATVQQSTRQHLVRHAARLGLEISHLESPSPAAVTPTPVHPDLANLRSAAPSMAAAWFTLRGCPASFPAEPATFDLLASMQDGVKRVQVKTTTTWDKHRKSWLARIGRRPHSEGNRAPLIPYDPDEIDLFFIVDGDLTMYLIPVRDIAGKTSLLLRAYQGYIVGNVREMTGGG
ncbi:MAG: group I intron-associated PD-(D/E)XK endonuclease, partial [Streptosporangiales bacterium]|nr:group I intron-associated PD-(D/E)XK endonuclease [Streptosporangiales bacterium]